MNSDCSVRILNSACDEIHSQIQFQLHCRGFANCMHARLRRACAGARLARPDRARDGGPEATMGARCPTTLRSLRSPVTTARCCPYRCSAAVRSSQRTGRSSRSTSTPVAGGSAYSSISFAFGDPEDQAALVEQLKGTDRGKGRGCRGISWNEIWAEK